MLGVSRSRMSLAFPISAHPAVHPGALAHRPEASSVQRSGPGRGSRPKLTAALPSARAGMALQEQGGPFAATHQLESFLSAEVATVPRNPRSVASSPPWAGDLGIDDPFWNSGPSEEELLFAADEELARTRHLPRSTEPPGTIERLGDLMTLLGPRYKTLPRGVIWEKAVQGDTTPLERQQKRLGVLAPTKPPLTIKRRAPEDAPDLDHEVAPRAAWLALRAQERERHNLTSA